MSGGLREVGSSGTFKIESFVCMSRVPRIYSRSAGLDLRGHGPFSGLVWNTCK